MLTKIIKQLFLLNSQHCFPNRHLWTR